MENQSIVKKVIEGIVDKYIKEEKEEYKLQNKKEAPQSEIDKMRNDAYKRIGADVATEQELQNAIDYIRNKKGRDPFIGDFDLYFQDHPSRNAPQKQENQPSLMPEGEMNVIGKEKVPTEYIDFKIKEFMNKNNGRKPNAQELTDFMNQDLINGERHEDFNVQQVPKDQMKQMIEQYKQIYNKTPNASELSEFLNQVGQSPDEFVKEIVESEKVDSQEVQRQMEAYQVSHNGRLPSASELAQFMNDQLKANQNIVKPDAINKMMEDYRKENGQYPNAQQLQDYINKHLNDLDSYQKEENQYVNPGEVQDKIDNFKQQYGRLPTSKELSDRFNEPEEEKYQVPSSEIKEMMEQYKEEFGKYPNAKQLEQYQNIQKVNKIANNDLIDPSQVNQMIDQFKEKNGGKQPSAKELQDFWNQQQTQEKILPEPDAIERFINDYLKIYNKLPTKEQVEDHFGQKFDGMQINMATDAFMNDIRGEFKNIVGSNPTKEELEDYLQRNYPDGQQSRKPTTQGAYLDEVKRVENLLKNLNGGREPTFREIEDYIAQNGLSNYHPQIGSNDSSWPYTNVFIIGFAVFAMVVYWIRRKTRSNVKDSFKLPLF